MKATSCLLFAVFEMNVSSLDYAWRGLRKEHNRKLEVCMFDLIKYILSKMVFSSVALVSVKAEVAQVEINGR